ncbi:hypothetical protein CKA32_004647 [Geitlerinema sp. FC II]|nr:hypothetical protein CKA32_004647 [Geitlerinema sp. FC II]
MSPRLRSDSTLSGVEALKFGFRLKHRSRLTDRRSLKKG